MVGKFAGDGLQSIDEDDDMLSAMAGELAERNGIGEFADAVWNALNREHRKLFPATSGSGEDVASINVPRVFDDTQSNFRDIVKRSDRRRLGFAVRATAGLSGSLESRGARLSQSGDRYSISDEEPERGEPLSSFTMSSLREATGCPKHFPARRAPIRGAKAFRAVPSRCNSPRAR